MPTEHPLSGAFLAAAAPPLRAEVTATPWTPVLLEKTLAEISARARDAYPELQLGAEAFLAHAAARVSSAAELEQLRSGDLYLACASLHRDRAALRILEERFFSRLDPALGKLRLTAERVADVKQSLRDQLLVGTAATPPRLSAFTGRGDLHGWLRVTAVRAALRLARKGKRELPMEDDALLAAHTSNDDPELAYIKEIYRAQFKEAFQSALDSLSDREKNLLRQNIVDGLGIDDLSGLYRAHRATVARWLASARELLLRRTRERFIRTARISNEECDSIMRLVHSQLDGTVRRRLQEIAPR
ncbi:RNA polymerase subunit sigma-70 [Pendulispora brunnea]|uniref:RNA polymerase subunit sigma-70 n=1 Tax=Pendulispora brunnea TaxID=2905690 RepID=A0ABZ2K1Z4_9BACT